MVTEVINFEVVDHEKEVIRAGKKVELPVIERITIREAKAIAKRFGIECERDLRILLNGYAGKEASDLWKLSRYFFDHPGTRFAPPPKAKGSSRSA
jgi:hypothetical protein